MWDTIGQSKAAALLDNAIKRSTLAHAYLFTGPAHVGKAKLALELAQAVNCTGAEPPCGQCDSCRRIAEGKHADVIVIGKSSQAGTSDKQRTKISIDEVRELEHSASLSPYEGKYRVYIVDGAEDLSGEAANCFLKTLEEPPPNVIIVLLATEAEKLLPTIVSRCQKIELKPIPLKDIEHFLVSSCGIEEDRARLFSLLSGGGIGWAIKACGDAGYAQKRLDATEEMLPLFSASFTDRFNYIARIEQDRSGTDERLKLWLIWWRDLMLMKSGLNDYIVNIDYTAQLQALAEGLALSEIKGFIRALELSLDQLKANANGRLVLEVLMLNMPVVMPVGK